MSNKFKVKKITSFDSLVENKELEIPTSDLCLTSESHIVQFDFIEDEDDQEKHTVHPGVYTVNRSMGGLKLDKTEIREENLLTSVVNTKTILSEVDIFFSKLDVYEKLNQPKKRAVLMYGPPGTGKTSVIRQFIRELRQKDPGTTVFFWPTSDVRAEDMSKFLSFYLEYEEACSNLILVMEDIGGGEEEGGRLREVSSAMLNLLDGSNVVFKKPTFIVATTNHPENLLESLADRPGRFDYLMEMSPPKKSEQLALMEFIAKRQLTEEEKAAFNIVGAENLSVAHLKEIIIRSLLHDRTFESVITEMVRHQEKVKSSFQKREAMGFRSRWDD